VVHLGEQGEQVPPPARAPISQERRNDLNRALYLMLAKMRCRGHALSCFLDDPCAELMPRHASHSPAAAAGEDDLVVNPSFQYAPGGGPPQELYHRPPPQHGLLSGFPLAWTEDPGPRIWFPLWARGQWPEVLESLRPGRPPATPLPPSIRHTLGMANVLVPRGYDEERRIAWERICRDARAQFTTQGYAIVRELIPPVHLAALRRYYRALVADGRLPRGDDQVAERCRLHSEPVGMFFHPQLAGLMSRIAGEPVKPSYLYFANYPSGSVLPRHVDRQQCEFSISLLVDYSPEPTGPCGWPLFLEHPDLPAGVVGADLGLGDAVLYRGRQLVHYRDRLPDGHHSSSLFLHYLREDFVGDTF
jgi:hypothetical protein